jgi:DNA replication licensing factor MCM3
MNDILMMNDRLLISPFDYSQAFDRALKDVIKTLPNRPARETAEDVVCHPTPCSGILS